MKVTIPMRNRLYAILCLPVLLSCLWLCGCGGKKAVRPKAGIDWKKSLVCFEDLETHDPKKVVAISKKPDAPKKDRFVIDLYVDQTESMRGYVTGAKAPEYSAKGSNFLRLLQALGNQAETSAGQTKSFGSGVPGKPNDPVPDRKVDLQAPKAEDFNLLSNDYGPLMESILREKQPDHITLVVTDGVQSHQEMPKGSLMGSTASACKKWVADGGTVDILIGQAPFKGKYFSEEARAKGKPYTLENVSKPDRPFMVMAFIPRAELLNEWDELKKKDRLPEIGFKEYRLPQETEESAVPSAKPVAVEFTAKESKDLGWHQRATAPYLALENRKVDAESPWSPNLYAGVIWRTSLRPGKPGAVKRVPICFEISAPSGGAEVFDYDKFRSVSPTLTIYERSGAKGAASPAGTGKQDIGPAATASGAEPVQDEKPPEKSGLPALPGPMATGGAAAGKAWSSKELDLSGIVPEVNEMRSDAAGKKVLRLCYLIEWPLVDDLVCVLRMESAREPLAPHHFQDLNTFDDQKEIDLGKVYNLSTLMQQLMENEKKTARPSGFILHLTPLE